MYPIIRHGCISTSSKQRVNEANNHWCESLQCALFTRVLFILYSIVSPALCVTSSRLPFQLQSSFIFNNLVGVLRTVHLIIFFKVWLRIKVFQYLDQFSTKIYVLSTEEGFDQTVTSIPRSLYIYLDKHINQINWIESNVKESNTSDKTSAWPTSFDQHKRLSLPTVNNGFMTSLRFTTMVDKHFTTMKILLYVHIP